MATNIYGKCNGSSGAKYNLWLAVTENSHSVSANTSNVTVSLRLKRNDGYSNSAYNLNELENKATLTVAGSVKKNINLEIDTRNNATVTLCTWTGNVSHNSDGSLNLSLAGSFTINGTSLTGGSVSGSFKCVTIQRASTLSLAKTSFVPEEMVNGAIVTSSTAFSHQLTVSLGSYKKTINIEAGLRIFIFSVPNDWANAIPKAKSGAVSLVLKTFNGSSLIGSYTTSITLTIPRTNTFLPDFDINLTTANNSEVPSGWTSLVKTKSTATIALSNVKYKYGASFSSNFVTVNTIKKTSIPATFPLNDAGEIPVKVRLTDSRGYYREKTTSISVTDYKTPSLVVENVYRSDSVGNPSKTGTYAKIFYKINYSSVNGENKPIVKIKFKKGSESNYAAELTSNASPIHINGDFQSNSSYDFICSITDAVTQRAFEVRCSIPSGNVPFNIKKGGDGVGVGCYAEKENEMTVAYNLNVKGMLNYTSLNNLVVAGEGFSIRSVNIKRYDCLGFSSVNVVAVTEKVFAANTWIDVLNIQGVTLHHLCPLPTTIEFYTPDKTLAGIINRLGYIKVICSAGFKEGDVIYIKGIFD